MQYFKVFSALDIEVSTTKQYWQKIVTIKHPAIRGKEEAVKRTLKKPVQVRRSRVDPELYLYYSPYRKRYLCVIARHENEKGFIVTVYITDKIKEGKIVWKK